jgi:DNA helicase II / ATP-dependent DNA helicase PcrA
LYQEYPYLEDTAQILIAQILKEYANIEKLEEDIEKQIQIVESTTGDDKSDAVHEYNILLTKIQGDIDRINLKLDTLNSPYFGKILFNRIANKKFPAREVTAYIGRFGIFDTKTNKMMVTDWRAPIANIYYQNSGPTKHLEFESPVGKQEGALDQKRQFEIHRARITNIYDAKTGNVAADEFLLSQLKGRVGKKLTDIVATIQSQQNEIIREEINKPIIIQGVAGSGKTTILLHKIAYLLFKHPKAIHPRRSIIIAPNKMFLDYISDVLPSLGIDSLEHNTFLFWAKKILGWDYKFTLSTVKDDLEIKEIKGSYKFKLFLEEYFATFEKDLLERIPSSMKYDISEKYYALKESHSNISMKERLDLSIDYAASQRQFNKNLREGYVAPVQGLNDKIKTIKDYVNKKYNPYKIYRHMFEYIEESKYFDKDTIKKLRKYHKKTLVSKGGFTYYKMEDLPPLLWLHFELYGKTDHIKDYVLADEAQDFSPFQILILRSIAKRDNITLAGDLAQAIIPPFHIKNWEEIISMLEKEGLKNQELSYHQLHRCYRTTVEIIEFANKIFKKHFPKEFKLPEAVLRHGEKVEEIITNDENDLNPLIKKINKEFEKDVSSVALICKDINHANELHRSLIKRKKDIKRQILGHDEDNYESGLMILPIEKAKGLEFDTVIMADMSEERYPVNELNIRLFYVGVTRALHKLYIHTTKSAKKSPLLEL